jgi:hypothetical protein
MINTYLRNTFTHWLNISGITHSQSFNSCLYASAPSNVAQSESV